MERFTVKKEMKIQQHNTALNETSVKRSNEKTSKMLVVYR